MPYWLKTLAGILAWLALVVVATWAATLWTVPGAHAAPAPFALNTEPPGLDAAPAPAQCGDLPTKADVLAGAPYHRLIEGIPGEHFDALAVIVWPQRGVILQVTFSGNCPVDMLTLDAIAGG